tara:strand:+ start:607 stop:1242 length:636 start_codon:yes stop_codon:yes gene_type:complete
MFASLNLFDKYNENKIPSCPNYCGIEHVHRGEKMDLKKLQAMIQPKAAVPDNTKQNVFEVFADKSQEGDTIKNNALSSLKQAGMTEEDILGMVMGSVGGGAAGKGVMGALKGIGGKLKGLTGKIGSKAKFPQGYGAPQSPGQSPELPSFIRKSMEKQNNPLQLLKKEEETVGGIQAAIKQLMNPNTVIREEGIKKGAKAGMRQFGKFNRKK